MAHQGLLSWVNLTRLTMAQDPGREAFKDEVQKHGFSFLDDYLENIVSGARQDPLIELVKTPGRKRVITGKPKLMSSKLGAFAPLSFESKSTNENYPPENSQVFNSVSPLDRPGESKSEAAVQKSDEHYYVSRPPLISIQPTDDASRAYHPHQLAASLVVEPTSEHPPLTNQEHAQDLSVIAEDEELSERSHASNPDPVGRSSSVLDTSLKALSEAPPSIPVFSSEHVHKDSFPSQGADATASISSMDTFHSVPLQSPTALISGVPQLEPTESQDKISGSPSTQTNTEIRASSPKDEGYHEMDEHLSSERKLSERHTTPSFPTLPEPMPLRKSMKPLPHEPSLNAVMTGAATPGGLVGGKRTSWLMKAREAKALEGGKKPFAFATNLLSSVPFMHQAVKRKSEDILVPQSVVENEGRQPKIAKTQANEVAPRLYKEFKVENIQRLPASAELRSEEETRDSEPQAVLDLLKKTVEGLGIRGGKTSGKSLGGANAAIKLAEARAVAEARVAERDRKEEEKATNVGSIPTTSPVLGRGDSKSYYGPQDDGRLSISDLFPKDGHMKEKHKATTKLFQFKPQIESSTDGQFKDLSKPHESTSTTPPNSPPVQTESLQMPVTHHNLNKHTPVFVPPTPAPVQSLAQRTVFNPPEKDDSQSQSAADPPADPAPLTTFEAPPALPLTAHSTLDSVQSDKIFDCEDIPAWMPNTQDTEYTYDNQTQSQNEQICDEEDSWPVDDKLAVGVQWTVGGLKEDSMTWSTLPTQSQRGDTNHTADPLPMQEKQQDFGPSNSCRLPGSYDQEPLETSDEQVTMTCGPEFEESALDPPKVAFDITESKLPHRSQSQMSMASSESSQLQLGFLVQASKLLNSALGTGKKKQPEVKAVLQKAAVAAKKQQEEADKKAARLKEMESRRQLALQRKADEEKTRILEEERKLKEDSERRKKEREGNTEKRTLKLPSAKKEEEGQKKRKIEVEKKQEIKKPGPSGKAHLKSASKQNAASSSFAYASLAYAASTINIETETSGAHKGKGKDQTMLDDEVSQPSQLVQSQMAARAKAQIDAAKKVEAAIPSESIELPDINSEYSDSEDEERVRTFDPPDWAQSPELRQALEMQSTINPDDIFGAVRPLKMEEIFKTRTSRFRARTSSANWTGTDRLTLQEEREYARRMGFK